LPAGSASGRSISASTSRPGPTIVTLQALDPILIDFYVPQQALKDVRPGQAVSASVDTFPGVAFPGVIESINSKVDPASRNVQIRASFRTPITGSCPECSRAYRSMRPGDERDHSAADCDHL
jgi:multidrug efflux pump subunit AcrA (membrane-fusion protein)